jgi:hypothetical protein
VRAYEDVVREAGATFVNDHIAFRTLAGQSPLCGLASLSRIFEALGYDAAGCYRFPDKHLSAVHFQHPNGAFPKIFISELKVWELPAAAREIVVRTLALQRPAVHESILVELATLDARPKGPWHTLLNIVQNQFQERPWPPPDERDVRTLNETSQYAAWVLVHGHEVNHFTSLINSHGPGPLATIEQTIEALRRRGVPMKAEIEGAPGSRLRQSATEAAEIDVPIRSGTHEATMPWTYAYFELAERGEVVDPETGRKERFEGFLGPQATNLFEMTRVKK